MLEFKNVTQKADESLSGIRATANEVSRELAEANTKSRSLRDELAFLVERADRLAEKIATTANDPIREDTSKDKRRSNETGDNIESASLHNNHEDDGQSEAERELLNALRRVK